jgi:cell division protein FtsI/penicillin-binding protein 2
MGINSPYIEVLHALMGICTTKTKTVLLTNCPKYYKKAKKGAKEYLCGKQNGDAFCGEIVTPWCTKDGTCSSVAPKNIPKTARRRLQSQKPFILRRFSDTANPNSKFSLAFMPEACFPNSLHQNANKGVCDGGFYEGFTSLVSTIQAGLDKVAELTKKFSKATQISRKKLFLCNSWKRIKEAEKKAKVTAANIIQSSMNTGKIYIKIMKDYVDRAKKMLAKESPSASAAQQKLINEEITPFLDEMKAITTKQQVILPASWRLVND